MFNMQVLKLPICYRCDKRIIDFVQELVEDIEAFKDQPELSDLRYSSVEEIDDGDFVLCRVNSLLMELAVQLILQGKPRQSQRGGYWAQPLQAIAKKQNQDAETVCYLHGCQNRQGKSQVGAKGFELSRDTKWPDGV